ncbi:hypothetical protein BCR36DRAFT_285157, partial [Piromyces finnis]
VLEVGIVLTALVVLEVGIVLTALVVLEVGIVLTALVVLEVGIVLTALVVVEVGIVLTALVVVEVGIVLTALVVLEVGIVLTALVVVEIGIVLTALVVTVEFSPQKHQSKSSTLHLPYLSIKYMVLHVSSFLQYSPGKLVVEVETGDVVVAVVVGTGRVFVEILEVGRVLVVFFVIEVVLTLVVGKVLLLVI